MSFDVFVDATANLPQELSEGIHILPCVYTLDGKTETYDGNLESFDARKYYGKLRRGAIAQTSMLNMHSFLSYFTPVLRQGRDIIYISMSSGISGTFNAASMAALELMETYQGRTVYVVDSKGCGLGSGRLAVRAAQLGRQGRTIHETKHILDEEVAHSCQYFIVEDLGFLKRTGRISGFAAELGTLLHVNPILYGNEDGLIVASKKVRGRKRALLSLAETYGQKREPDRELPVCISHGDCAEDAALLEQLIRERTPEVELIIALHEPVSGAHVGPGMLGLFFSGKSR